MLRKPPKRTNQNFKEEIQEYFTDIINPHVVDVLYGDKNFFETFMLEHEKFNLPTALSRVLLAVMDDVTKEIGEIHFDVMRVVLESVTVLVLADAGLTVTEDEAEGFETMLKETVTHVLTVYLRHHEGKYKPSQWKRFQQKFKTILPELRKQPVASIATGAMTSPSPLILPRRIN